VQASRRAPRLPTLPPSSVAARSPQLLIIDGTSSEEAIQTALAATIANQERSVQEEVVRATLFADVNIGRILDDRLYTWQPLASDWTAPEVGTVTATTTTTGTGDAGGSDESSAPSPSTLTIEWASEQVNMNALTSALATSLGLQPHQVLIQSIVALSSPSRRLQRSPFMLPTPRDAIIAELSLQEASGEAGAAGRELASTASLEGFKINFIVNMSATDNIAAVEAGIAALSAPSSPAYAAFVTNLQQELTQRGIVLPDALNTLTLMPSSAVVQNGYVMAISEWLIATAWGICPTTCGESTKTREIFCSSGNEAACNQTGTAPPIAMPCEDYTECPFDPLCPINKGDGSDCGTQNMAVAGTSGALFIFICGPLCCWCRVKCKRPKQGWKRLKRGKWAKWKRQDKNEVEDADGKIHIIWDIGNEKINELEGNQQMLEDGALGEEDGAPAIRDVAQASEGEDMADLTLMIDSNPTSPKRGDKDHEDGDGEIIDVDEYAATNFSGINAVAYENGQRVEYYSNTHKQWLTAVIAGADGEEFVLGIGARGQQRRGISIDYLRPPFQDGEAISVFSLNRKQWSPCEVSGAHGVSASEMGYKVRHLEETLSNDGGPVRVPSNQLRRRFSPGDLVEVFRGPFMGWVDDTVEEELPGPQEVTSRWVQVKLTSGEPAEGMLSCYLRRRSEAKEEAFPEDDTDVDQGNGHTAPGSFFFERLGLTTIPI